MRVTANQVTSARLLAMPLVGWLIYGGPTTQAIGVAIGTLIGLTDTVDGYLARKHGPTVLGSLLDPVADKIFIVVCYGCFADRGGIPWWIAAAIFSREFLVTVLRSSLELGGQRLPSTGIAKVKTWVQMLAFGFLVLIPLIGSGPGLRVLFAAPVRLRAVGSRHATTVRDLGGLPARVRDRRGRAGSVRRSVVRRRRGGREAADRRGRLHHLVQRARLPQVWLSSGRPRALAPPSALAAARGRRAPADRGDGGARHPPAADDPAHHPSGQRHGARRARQLCRQPGDRRLFLGGEHGGRAGFAGCGAGLPAGGEPSQHRGGGGRRDGDAAQPGQVPARADPAGPAPASVPAPFSAPTSSVPERR